jgi:hypothetical protein
MKKIYINHTKRALVFGKTLLLPGSNVAEEIDSKQYPLLNTLMDNEEVEITEDTAAAAKKANTQEALNEIVKAGRGDGKTVENAKKRRQQLDKLDEEAKAAFKSSKKEESEEEEGA